MSKHLLKDAESHGTWGKGADGYSIGIIGVHTDFPLLPGNVVNARTFSFPVYIRVLDGVSGSDILSFNDDFVDPIVSAGQELVELGVRAVVGACGSFANYQSAVAAALPVPTYMSVMLQTPLILLGLRPDQSIGVLTFRASALTPHVFTECGISDSDRLHLYDTADMEQSALLRNGDARFDNKQFGKDLAKLAEVILCDRPDTGALILQCSELPPYAAEIQRATKLPVYDMNSLIGWAYHAVEQRNYQG